MTSHHDLRQALNEARAAFTRLTDVFEATLAELGRSQQECQQLRSTNEALINSNKLFQVEKDEIRDRLWTVEAECDTANDRLAARDRETTDYMAQIAQLNDEVRKLRDVILNVAVAIDNEVKVDPKPAQGSSPSFSAIDEARDAAHDGTRPITGQSLMEDQERAIQAAIDGGLRPAYV